MFYEDDTDGSYNKVTWIDGCVAVADEGHRLDQLRDSGATHILVVSGRPVEKGLGDLFVVEEIPMMDTIEEELLSGKLEKAIRFIQQAVDQGGKVIVRCFAGVSRSVAIVMGYFMWTQRLTHDEAFKLVRAHRRQASPNMGFSIQLITLEHSMTGGCTDLSTTLKNAHERYHSPTAKSV